MRRRIIIGATFACIAAGVCAFCVWAIQPIRQPVPVLPSTKILDRSGKLLYEIARPTEGSRTLTPLSDIPESLQHAVIASEDAHFYRHAGVDIFATIRAGFQWFSHGQRQGGASTLEQQLIKSLYFPTQERTVLQKTREMVAAVYWASTHTKEETLEAYLNAIYFGNRAYGVSAAAASYFHKDVGSLTTAESALLVGIIPSPSSYEPILHRNKAEERKISVLQRMKERGDISAELLEEATQEHPPVFQTRHTMSAPHFVFHVMQELNASYPDLASGGYTVYTTLDADLQHVTEDVMERKLAAIASQHVTNGAAFAVHPHTGEILAYVGSNGYFDDAIDGKIDMVTARRQPGSALKPFLYVAAFLEQFTPATVIADLPVRFETVDGQGYVPKNYGYRYNGPVSIRESLGSSLNIPAVKVLDTIGLSTFFGVLSRFGITFPESPEHYGLGIVLGGGETTLHDVTLAYARLAQRGLSVTPYDVIRIENARGKELFHASPVTQQPVLNDPTTTSQAIDLVTDILADPTARARSFGETNALDIGKRVAVKTGTTRDFRDNWAFGYTPDIALGVWVGNADNSPMEGVTGVTGAVPIWHDVMAYALRTTDDVDWPHDSSLVTRNICVTSGLLANGICPKTRTEKFISGTAPTRPDDWYVRACGKTYLFPPPEYAAWQTAAQHEQPPADCAELSQRISTTGTVIISPLDGEIFLRDDLVRMDSQKIPFIAGGDATHGYDWSLNGEMLHANASTLLWTPQAGDYTLSLKGANRQIHFTVK